MERNCKSASGNAAQLVSAQALRGPEQAREALRGLRGRRPHAEPGAAEGVPTSLLAKLTSMSFLIQ